VNISNVSSINVSGQLSLNLLLGWRPDVESLGPRFRGFWRAWVPHQLSRLCPPPHPLVPLPSPLFYRRHFRRDGPYVCQRSGCWCRHDFHHFSLRPLGSQQTPRHSTTPPRAMPNSRVTPDISILHKLPFLTAVVEGGLPLFLPSTH